MPFLREALPLLMSQSLCSWSIRLETPRMSQSAKMLAVLVCLSSPFAPINADEETENSRIVLPFGGCRDRSCAKSKTHSAC